MKTYEVIISEIVATTYHIKAKNKEEAEEKYYTECIDHERSDTVDSHIEEINELDDCPHSKWQQKGEPETREDGTPYLKWDADIQCTCD